MPHWDSYHLYLHSDTTEVDGLLTSELAPLLDGLVGDGQASAWFFIRYGEGGPHLRIRVRHQTKPPAEATEADYADATDATDATDAAGLAATLSRLGKALPAVEGSWESAHGELRLVPYLPETERYGGELALPEAEEVFAVSSRVAVLALARRPGAAERLALGIDLAHVTALALGLDRLAAAQWLRRQAAGWRWVTEVPLLPGAVVHARVNSVFALQHRALVRRAEALWSGPPKDAAPWLTLWADRVRASTVREPWVWASQLHMLFNRLGITPDEERAVCRLAARTLLDTGEPDTGAPEAGEPDTGAPPSFFPEGHRAPDHQYLERSKFQAGRPQDSTLRLLPPQALTELGRPEPRDVVLPAGPLPAFSLHQAITERVSARGQLTGPLTADTLGTLLWSTLAESHHSENRLGKQHHSENYHGEQQQQQEQQPDGTSRSVPHRPYPSAGALYTVRLRLIALNVEGLAAGTYQCVPEQRTLRPVGPAPSIAELTALSSYFSRPAEDPDLVGIAEVPAVLGLHLEFGLLRRRYGLRALRLGLLEVGHLAQTLLLTATALGLRSIPLSGFLDDLAHELFGLDDLDQPLQYLLPLGRRTD